MPKKELISLRDFNEQRFLEADAKITGKVKNGIECPRCGSELVDATVGILLTSYPPQKPIKCPKCGFRGTRYV